MSSLYNIVVVGGAGTKSEVRFWILERGLDVQLRRGEPGTQRNPELRISLLQTIHAMACDFES